MEIDSNHLEELNKEFSELVGIKKVRAFIINKDSEEIRYYSHPSAVYKIPKGWENVITGVLKNAIYPDFTEPYNFIKLINIQWEVFGSLGPQYNKLMNEPFELNYLINKIQGIKIARSFGGGELLDEYIEKVRKTDFDYDIGESDDYVLSTGKED
jgi:hypothetical protein